MIKYLATIAIAVLIGIGSFFVWQRDYYSNTPIEESTTQAQVTTSADNFYTIESLNAHIKIPEGWIFVTNDNNNIVGFRSPDFQESSGSNNLFPSMEANNVVRGAAIIMPRSLNETMLEVPCKMISLDGQDGGLISRVTGEDEGAPAYKISHLTLDRDGNRFVILTMKSSLDFQSDVILNDIISSFKFVK